MAMNFGRVSAPGIRLALQLRATTLLAGAMVCFLSAGCSLLYRDLQSPTVEVVGIQPESIQPNLSITLRTLVRVTNPNDVPLPVEGGELELYLNDQRVADSQLREPFELPPNGSSDIPLLVNVDLASGLAIGLNILSSADSNIRWQLSGHIDVAQRYLGRIPVKESGVLQLPTPDASADAQLTVSDATH